MTTQNNTQSDERTSRMKFWGAAVILLMMVLMVFSTNIASNFTRNRGGASETAIGTASNGRKVTLTDRDAATNFLHTLDMIQVQLPGQAGTVPIAVLCWGETNARELGLHPEAVALLLKEADANGPGASGYALGSLDPTQHSSDTLGLMNSGVVSVGDLHPIEGTPLYSLAMQYQMRELQIVVPRQSVSASGAPHMTMVLPSDLPPQNQEAIYETFREFLGIQAVTGLMNDAASKISQPMVERVLAENRQAFTLQLAAFDATPKLAATTQPTDAQLATQLTTFADKQPGAFTRDNPFGFGYRVPDRVKLEMISFKRGDVRAIVQAEKSAYDWEVAARKDFARDPSDFFARLPTTHPAAIAATQPSMPKPTFDSMKAEALGIEVDRSVDARVAEIKQRIHSTMQFDYLAWFNVQAQQHGSATTAPAAPSSLEVPYTSPEYFDRVAEVIQKEFHLLPTVARYGDQFRDARQLGALGSFSHAEWTIPEAVAAKLRIQVPLIDAPTYATQFPRALMPAAAQPNAGEAILEDFEPSDPVETAGPDVESFVFRVTAAQPHHPATTADDLMRLHDQLAQDYRLAEAQRQTVAEATAAANAASPANDLQVPGHPVQTVTVGPFGGADAAPPPPQLGLAAMPFAQFAQRINDTLLTDPKQTPVVVLDVPIARRTYVARRVEMWSIGGSEQELAQLRVSALNRAAADARTAIDADGTDTTTSDYLSVKQILARNEYKPVRAQ